MTHRGKVREAGLTAAVAALLMAALLLVPLPATDARADGPARASEVVGEEGSGEPGDGVDRWWGVVGAAICGFEFRLILRAPAVGMNPYMLAAGIAGCSLAALDVLTTK